MTLRLPLLLAVLVATLLATSCGTPPTAGPASGSGLPGTHWVLVELNATPPIEGTNITAEFTDDGRLVGSGGCNRYFSGVTTTSGTIGVDEPVGATMMACEEPVMVQESAYFEALAAARTFTTTDDRLTLENEAGQPVVVFKAQSQDLVGTSWRVVAYNNGESAVVNVLEGTSPTITFEAEEKVSGNGGCNGFGGEYAAAEDGTVSIGPLIRTMMACEEPPGATEQEGKLLASIESAATFRIEGERLSLRTSRDEIATELTRV